VRYATPSKKLGRPTKATDDRIAAIVLAIASGVPVGHAARAAGVHRSTLSAWRAENSDISDRLEKAEAEAVQFHVAIVRKAAIDGVWTASAWWLERTHPAEFGKRLRTDQSVTVRDEAADLASFRDAVEQVIPDEITRKEIAVALLRFQDRTRGAAPWQPSPKS
jgi:transposase-like protein